MSRKIKQEISKLNDQDTFSLILFALFKLRDVPEYSALSEMAYILDREAVLKLCEYFGGMTLKIPTTKELESIVCSLVMYQKVDIEGESYDDAVKTIGCDSSELRKLKHDYECISTVLKNYNFNRCSG